MVTPGSPLPNSLPSENTGGFVTMPMSYYLELLRRLECLERMGVSSSGHESLRPTVSPQVDAVQSDVHQPGKRLKVACIPCSDAHKKCDQGRPCSRCAVGNDVDACVYPLTKGGRRTNRNAPGSFATAAPSQQAEGSSMGHLGHATGLMPGATQSPPVQPAPSFMFPGGEFAAYGYEDGSY